MVNFYIYFAVIVSGASVLAIEMLGTRIIAPFYGVSLYLWSALISVTLAGLSVGYAIGGRWADRGPQINRFATVIGLAGLWIVFIPWLKTPILAVAEPLGLRAAVLAAATVLFFPPLALLGMVSPYAIRLKAASLDVVGTTAGNLYAVSTLASVVAAIGTGFFLIPNIGVYRLVFLIGLALIATAVLGLVSSSKMKSAIVAPGVFGAVALLVMWVAPAQTANPDKGLMAVEQSVYGDIRVVDMDDVRYMLIDGGTHTIVDKTTGWSLFPYVNVLDISKLFFDQPGEMLLVGLGGGSVVKSFVADGWKVDAVEIDPVVTKMAYEFFMLKPDEARVYTMDARQHLMTHDKQYDIIVMDAFGSSAIPFHLVTEEAFELIRSRLKPGGILAMNIEAVGWHDRLVHSLAVTAGQAFSQVRVLPMAEPPSEIGNLVIMAADRSLELAEDPPVPSGRFTAEYDRAHAWDNRFEVESDGVTILTDRLNPVDIWAERINVVARKQLHEYFGDRGIAW
jgi:spermidine synthase